jgi:hypothetical protein
MNEERTGNMSLKIDAIQKYDNAQSNEDLKQKVSK